MELNDDEIREFLSIKNRKKEAKQICLEISEAVVALSQLVKKANQMGISVKLNAGGNALTIENYCSFDLEAHYTLDYGNSADLLRKEKASQQK